MTPTHKNSVPPSKRPPPPPPPKLTPHKVKIGDIIVISGLHGEIKAKIDTFSYYDHDDDAGKYKKVDIRCVFVRDKEGQ